MAFRFPLQSLLKLHESLEQAEFTKLQAAAAVVLELRSTIELIEKERAESTGAIFEELNRGISGSELEFEAARQRTLMQLLSRTAQQHEAAEKARIEQLSRYQSARQKREILANLRVRQFEAFSLIENRRAQNAADDLHLQRMQLAEKE